jgi:hypothetical protein
VKELKGIASTPNQPEAIAVPCAQLSGYKSKNII